jgi:hypothetical protein
MSFKESLFSICPEHRQIEPVDTPAGRTYVRALTVAEKDDFDKDVQESGGVSRPYILIHFCCKEDGSAEFDGFDINKINRMPAGMVEPIINAALKLNRLSSDDVEGVRKNSENGQPASSSSA